VELDNFRVTDTETIRRVLIGLKKSTSDLEVRFDGEDRVARTRIQSCHPDKGYFTLRVLDTISLHRRVLHGDDFQLVGWAHGVHTEVQRLAARDFVDDPRHECYVVPVPDELIYVQRRECYRAQVARFAEVFVKVQFAPDDGPWYDAHLIDLGADGCRIGLQGIDTPPTGFRDGLTALQLMLPGETRPIAVQGNLRHWHWQEDTAQLQAGYQFHRLRIGEQDRIQRYVSEIQREMCRREAMVGG